MSSDKSSKDNIDLSDKKMEYEISRISRLAIASLISVIAAIICIVGVIVTNLDTFGQIATVLLPTGLVLGIISVFVICRHKYLRGYGFVIAPIVLGGGFILMMGLGELRLRNRAYAERTYSIVYNLKNIRKVMIEYATSNNGHLPASDKWCDVLMEYDKNLSSSDFKHPKTAEITIGFNKNLIGKRLSDIPDDVVLLFEAKGDLNLVGDEGLLQKQKNNFEYLVKTILVNGKVKSYWFDPNIHSSSEKPLNWKP